METLNSDQRVAHAVHTQDLVALAALLVADGERTLHDAVQQFRDAQQRSLAHLAIQDDSIETLDFVLANGLDVDANCEDHDGHSPVACAVLDQRFHALRMLLSYGASASTLDSDHRSLLHLLAVHSAECDLDACSSIVDVLLRTGDMDIDARDQCGNTALHLAAVYGSPAVAAALLRNGADANAVNASGSSPLHFAASTGDHAIVQQLLAAGANVNAADALGNTPLIDAAFVTQSATSTLFAFGDHESQGRVVALLLASGADASAVNHDGNSALFGAVRNGFEDVVAQLSQRQTAATCFQQRNNQRETLLHVAARAQVTSVSIWETLLACCGLGSVRDRDRFERTCVHIWMAWPQGFAPVGADSGSDNDEEERLHAPSSSRRGGSIHAVSKLLLSIN